ncbi:MAG: DUF2235 domain-containing protein [Albidovulum sp.]|uniref:DUF2235 domain-containing protein n=1 Tax=Albidovulum sp. TaxID=1872424 RepID=UPI003C89CB80
MKRIAVFCDGTWNGADQAHPTNVRQMAVMVPREGRDGVEQRALYFQGVGVPEGGGFLERVNERVSGGAMGAGLDNKIALAYMHLGKYYEPGDEVYIFGFSRGAYTARSLAGLIRNSGLPRDPSAELVRACFDRYRDRSDAGKPDSEDSMRFRLRVSPGIATSEAEQDWRRQNGHPEGHPFTVRYLGIWDTVGALGIPSHWGLPARVLNRKYRFHDTELSRSVLSARHAVAIDEERRTFVPTLWTNLEKLRDQNPAGDYRQEWFAGTHGSVGGGGDIVSLSGIALIWIASGAIAAGLTLDQERLGAVGNACDHMGPLINNADGKSFGERLLGVTGRARQGPGQVGMVAHPAIARWRRDGRYRPGALTVVEADLQGFDLAQIIPFNAVAIV